MTIKTSTPFTELPKNKTPTTASWPIWEKEQSEFPWEYETTETFLVLTGDVTVTNEAEKQFHFKAGDYVIFPEGMKCTWKIHKAVRKHYKMG